MKLSSRQRRLLAEKETEKPEEQPEEDLGLDLPAEPTSRDELGAVNADGVDRQSDLEVMKNGIKAISLLKKAISMATAAKFIIGAPKKNGGLGRTDLAPQEGAQFAPPGTSPQQWLPTIPSITQQVETVIAQISDDLNQVKNKTQESEAEKIFNQYFDLEDVDVELETPEISAEMESVARVIDDFGLTESERYTLYGVLNNLLMEVAASGGGVGMGSGGSFFGVAAQDGEPEQPTLFRISDKKPYTSRSSRWYLPPTAGKKKAKKRETKSVI